MNNFIASMKDFAPKTPILMLYGPEQENYNPFPLVQYSMQWTLEINELRKEILGEMEQETPGFNYTPKDPTIDVDNHIDRIKNFLIPSLFSSLNKLDAEGNPLFDITKLDMSKIEERLEIFFGTEKSKLLAFVDLEVAKDNPAFYLCFWLSIYNEKADCLEDIFDVETQSIIGECQIGVSLTIAVADNNPNKLRFLTEKEVASIFG